MKKDWKKVLDGGVFSVRDRFHHRTGRATFILSYSERHERLSLCMYIYDVDRLKNMQRPDRIVKVPLIAFVETGTLINSISKRIRRRGWHIKNFNKELYDKIRARRTE